MSKILTIVVPIYNVEKYLNECLNSFVEQTCQDFLVLLIDDGSKDSSSDIAKDYAKHNPDLFKYIRQENKGLGGARNTGLSLVESDYLMFFDSDDFMANRAVEHILKQIENNPTEIIFFNPVIYDVSLHTYTPWHDAALMKEIFSNNEVVNPSKMPIFMLSEASVCRAVWKTSFLKRIGLKFIEHIHWEDVPPHFEIMHNAQSASFMDYEGAYFYRTNTGNQITAGSGKTRLEMKTIYEVIEKNFKDKSWSKMEKVFMLGFLSNYLLWSISVIDDEYLAEFVDITHNFLRRVKSCGLYLKFFFKCKVGLKHKILILALKSRLTYKMFKDKDKMNSKLKFLKKLKRILKR